MGKDRVLEKIEEDVDKRDKYEIVIQPKLCALQTKISYFYVLKLKKKHLFFMSVS